MGHCFFMSRKLQDRLMRPKVATLVATFPEAHRTAQVKGVLNRLLFEAGMLVVSELKSSVEAQEDAPRRLTPEERSSRVAAVKTRLGSWPLGGQFEPSHRLIDVCSAMVRDQVIRHIAPLMCSSREAEITSTKRDPHLITLEDNTLKVRAKQASVRVDVSTDLRLYQAVSRRGLALGVAGVCSYEVHERCMRTLFDHLHRQPPPQYVAPGAEHFLRADRELWKLVSEKVGHDVSSATGSAQVDKALEESLSHMNVVFHMMPCISLSSPASALGSRLHRLAVKARAARRKARAKAAKARAKARVTQDATFLLS